MVRVALAILLYLHTVFLCGRLCGCMWQGHESKRCFVEFIRPKPNKHDTGWELQGPTGLLGHHFLAAGPKLPQRKTSQPHSLPQRKTV